MSKSIDALFQLLAGSLCGRPISLPSDLDWKEVMTLACEQNVAALVIDSIESLPLGIRPTVDVACDWLGHSISAERQYQAQLLAAKEYGVVCHSAGYRVFVLKGFSLSSLYPVPSRRMSSDLDSYCIDNSGKWSGDSVDRVIAEMGIKVDNSYYKNSKFTFRGLTVENHRHILPVRGSRTAKELESWMLAQMIPSVSSHIDESYLERPTMLFMAVHVLAHAQEHFFQDGITLRYVTDWAMLLKNADSSVWEEWKCVCEKYGLLKFGLSLSRIANKVCGVVIPFDYPKYACEDERLLDDILTRGNNVNKSDSCRRIELLYNILNNSWKFRDFSDISSARFALRRIRGYFFE